MIFHLKFAENFNHALKAYSFRFVNNNDIVTRVPPRELQYSHVGTLKYFTEGKQLSDGMDDWSMFLDRMHGRISDILEWGTDGLKDHDMHNYVNLIRQAMVCDLKK